MLGMLTSRSRRVSIFFSGIRELNFSKSSIEKWQHKQNKWHDNLKKALFQHCTICFVACREWYEVFNCMTLASLWNTLATAFEVVSSDTRWIEASVMQPRCTRLALTSKTVCFNTQSFSWNCAVVLMRKPCTDSRLRSKSRRDFITPRTRLRFTDRAFAVSAPSAWNSLPIDIRDCSSEATFKKHLKTFLFHVAFI